MMKIYGSKISYYTGKLEAYLRYRGIDYQLCPTVGNEKRLKAGAGVVQMPVVEMNDGRWMTDTTPILAWLDKQYEEFSIYPDDSIMRFIALLIEDYADEWLWRSAMHYRWSYPVSRVYAAETLYRELIEGTLPLPRPLALFMLKRRQRGGFVKGDGLTAKTHSHVEQGFHTAITCLQTIFESRPFLLGKRPTIADYGLMAPMFRHFSMDPDPADIMRRTAPAVHQWVYRMWAYKSDDATGSLLGSLDEPLETLLQEIAETHLVQLRENAKAYSLTQRYFHPLIQGCQYKKLPVSRYRVWCLEELRREWSLLSSKTQTKLKSILNYKDCEVLWDESRFKQSGYDTNRQAPFNKAINVYGNGVPGS